MHNARLHEDLAAIGHRVARIDHEVHHHLVELPPVDADRQKPGIMVERQLDLLAHQPVQQVHQVRHGVAQVHDLSFSFCCAKTPEAAPQATPRGWRSG
jgi:hypothetical protein